jgi:chaperonin GroEL (HSP60 family)
MVCRASADARSRQRVVCDLDKGQGGTQRRDYLEPSVVLGKVAAGAATYGFSATTGEYGDMIAMGIIDPTKVTRLGLQNAASIASLILTTDCIIVEAPKHEHSHPEGPAFEP